MTTPTAFLIALALLGVSAPLAAAILRAARCPGWSVLGGLCAGLLVGATILGRVAPDFWGDVFVGGHAEQRAVDLHDMAVTAAPTVDPVRQGLVEAADNARWDHAAPLRVTTIVIAAIVLLLGGLGPKPTNEPRQSWLAPATVGLWSALLPGGITFAFCFNVFELGLVESMTVSAAVAVGPWRLDRPDADAASRAEQGGSWLLLMAGRAASLVAIAALGIVLFTQKPGAYSWVIALAAIPLGWLLAFIPHRTFEFIARWLLLPVLGALLTVRVDLIEFFHFWPTLLIVLVSGDGRWLGAFLGAIIPGGRTGLRAMKLIMGAMAAGPAQLAIAAMAVHCSWIGSTSAVALALGIVVMEVSAPARAATIQRIESMEDELTSS